MSRFTILALDGTPFSLLQNLIMKGVMPNLQHLVQQSDFRQMDSVQPPVSSAAWASFMTGRMPARHGIWGFTEREPATLNWFVPNADQRQGRTLWRHLSISGKRVFVMNVPVTYPPEEINGILIGGFLATDIRQATWPAPIGTLLKARGYRIDADTELAKRDLRAFYRHLREVLEIRLETMWHFRGQESWDFFMTHIMETDRLHHFFWEFMETGHAEFAPLFMDFYRRIDEVIGQLHESLAPRERLMLLSDHGFTTLKAEVTLNRFLWQQGYLRFNRTIPQNLQDMHPESLAYSLYPGRIYFNLRGREKQGSVESGLAYEELANRLSAQLMELRDPRNNHPVIREVLRQSQLTGKTALLSESQNPQADNLTPDLLAVAHDGYDLKGDLWRETLFDKTVFNGVHTFDDAFVLVHGARLASGKPAIHNLASLICRAMDVPPLNED